MNSSMSDKSARHYDMCAKAALAGRPFIMHACQIAPPEKLVSGYDSRIADST